MTKKENLQDHLGQEFQVEATGEKWTGQEIVTQSDPLIDDGSGKKMIVRCFEFKLPPDLPRKMWPSAKQLLDFHRAKIIAFLWRDELRFVEDIAPEKAYKLVFDKKDRRKFTIFATCIAKKGSLILKDPTLIQHATTGNK